ncbi:25675_t:CDS:2, partial [Dentiscutata erythropus]
MLKLLSVRKLRTLNKNGPQLNTNLLFSIISISAVDFGTRYSGFAYANTGNLEIITNDTWPEVAGVFKTNTVLEYDQNLKNVVAWGLPALAQKPSRRTERNSPVELFKLHLGNIPEKEKPVLPKGLNYKKVITDYLTELVSVARCWPNVNFMNQVLLIMAVPAEFSEQANATIREC